jgi:hypothetical protein
MAAHHRSGHRNRRRALADCRRGDHRFGSPRAIGGGIDRQTCLVCGAVSIDVTQADPTTGFTATTPRNTRQ